MECVENEWKKIMYSEPLKCLGMRAKITAYAHNGVQSCPGRLLSSRRIAGPAARCIGQTLEDKPNAAPSTRPCPPDPRWRRASVAPRHSRDVHSLQPDEVKSAGLYPLIARWHLSPGGPWNTQDVPDRKPVQIQ